jgi:hypothetical protein
VTTETTETAEKDPFAFEKAAESEMVSRESVAEFMERLEIDQEDVQAFLDNAGEADEDEDEEQDPADTDLFHEEEPASTGFKPVISAQKDGLRFIPPGASEEGPKPGAEPLTPEQFISLQETWISQAIPKFDEAGALELRSAAGTAIRQAREAEAQAALRARTVREDGNIELDSDPEWGRLVEGHADLAAKAEHADQVAQEAERRAAFAGKTDEALHEAARDLLVRWEEADDGLGQIPRLSHNRREKAVAERDALVVMRARIEGELAAREQDDSMARTLLGAAIAGANDQVREARKDAARKATKAFQEVEHEEGHPQHDERKKARNAANYLARQEPDPDETIWKAARDSFRKSVKARKPSRAITRLDMTPYLPKQHVAH